MYSFEGQFKSRPIQNLGGSSRKEQKTALLQRTQEERLKREDQRRRNASAVQIQSLFRGYKVRKIQKLSARHEFDRQCHQIQNKGQVVLSNTDQLHQLLKELIYFYDEHQDGQRLTILCQAFLRQHQLIASYVCVSELAPTFKVAKLLQLCLRHLMEIASTPSPLAAPMRMLEVFTSSDTYRATAATPNQPAQIVHIILKFLIDKGYYQCMRVLIDQKIPSSIEYTVSAPTPIAGSILDLVRRPLNIVTASKDTALRSACLSSLCEELFCSAYSEQISQYVLPALAYSKDAFPLVELLHALVPVCQSMLSTSQDSARVSHDQMEKNNWSLPVPGSPWLLCAILTLSEQHIEGLSSSDLQRFLLLLHQLVPHLSTPRNRHDYGVDLDSDDEDDDQMDIDESVGARGSLPEVRRACVRLLDQPRLVKGIVSAINREPDNAMLTAVCTVCHTLMAHNNLIIPRTRLFYSLAFNPMFIRSLWFTCCSASTTTVTGSQTTLIKMLSRGMQMEQRDRDRIIPLLSVFCTLFSNSLITLHDAEFYGDDPSVKSTSMPFQISELVPMSQALRDACIGIIELAHPDTKPTLKEDYRKAFQSVGVAHNMMTIEELQKQMDTWAYLFKVIVQLVRQLHRRDTRRRFCPHGHWLTNQVHIHADKPSQIYKAENGVFVRRPFGALSALNTRRFHGKMVEEEVPPLSTMEVRNLTVLMEMPFVVPFEERVKIFHRLVQQDKAEHQGEMRHFMGGPHISLMVRRNYLYEDAFEKLSPDNEPDLKLKMQVQLVNFAGLDEVGIDGGGIFREFMAELLKTSFDPNRGLFKYTRDRTLYPNPGSRLLMADFTSHYYFLGRILGKAMYESMLIELPFASFFLSKLLSRSHGNVDIHHLQSLDPEMYRNLLFLKNYDGDVSDLDLDFTVMNNELGEAQVVDLKPGGRDISVDSTNRIEYIHLMADYRLNKQIRTQCQAFRRGLAAVINLEWLRMFDHRELQTLISGAQIPIDIQDLREHTNYSGGYAEDHPVIKNLWSAVENFSEKQKRQLLKFVTSCSRPPLLGFKELHPAFCVHSGGKEPDRLPTASTCMNLLKLPEFKDEETLKAKLLYAIESGAGFELS